MRLPRTLCVAACLSVLYAGSVSAIEIPLSLKNLVKRRGGAAMVEKFEAIPAQKVQAFLDDFFASGPHTLVAAGTEGFIVRNDLGTVWKFSLAIAEALGILKVERENDKIRQLDKAPLVASWNRFKESPIISQLEPILRERSEQKWPLKNQSLLHEIYGSLLWSSFYSGEVNIPSAIATGGYAYKARFIPGPSLATLIQEEKAGKTAYPMAKVWARFVDLQRQNEAMLIQTGYAVDILSPSNIIVSGSLEDPRLFPVDNSLAIAQESTHHWFTLWGVSIPRPQMTAELKPFENVLISPHIVSHKLWDLNYEQALAYIRAYFELDKPEEVVAKLASVKTWWSDKYPELADHKSILTARNISGGTGWAGDEWALHSNVNVSALRRLCPELLQPDVPKTR